MSSLDLGEKRSDVPGSENMIQHAFDEFNGITGGSQEEATIRAIKNVLPLKRRTVEGIAAFKNAKDEMEKLKSSKTYVPTGEEIARDVENGLYREKLDGTER